MAKKRRKSKKKVQRDTRRISHRKSMMLDRRKRYRKSVVLAHEDKRYFRPLYGYAVMSDGRPAGVKLADRKKDGTPYKSLGTVRQQFVNPFKVIVCRRRKLRRQTLWARRLLNRGGRGGIITRRIGPTSFIRC